MKSRQQLLQALAEKEIQKYFIVDACLHACSRCGRETWRPKICSTCLRRVLWEAKAHKTVMVP